MFIKWVNLKEINRLIEIEQKKIYAFFSYCKFFFKILKLKLKIANVNII